MITAIILTKMTAIVSPMKNMRDIWNVELNGLETYGLVNNIYFK